MTSWILPIEKLPNDGDIVLVTIEAGTETEAGFATSRQVHEAYYYDAPDGDPWYRCFELVGRNALLTKEVVAWMPLPEPYEIKEAQ